MATRSSTTGKSAAGNASGAGKLKVTLHKSLAGQLDNISASVRGLGLRRPHHSVIVADTPENRGLVRAARHMLRVEPV